MFPWGGFTCCLGAAGLYLFGQNSDSEAETLKTITRVNQLSGLAQLLDQETQFLPVIVAVSGRVGSETPIKCEHGGGSSGVIVHERLEHHFRKQNKDGTYKRDSVLTRLRTTEVPWYLDDETGRVFIVEALSATGFAFPAETEVFEKDSDRSPEWKLFDYLQGIQMLGVNSIKRILPMGTYLTVVGEAVKDDIGTVRIQRPHKGPFYVSTESLGQIILGLGKWSRFYKYASTGLLVFGICLIPVEYEFSYTK